MEEVDAMTRQLKLTGPSIWTQGWTRRKTSTGARRSTRERAIEKIAQAPHRR